MLDQLGVFVRVAELGSLTKAGKLLGQPTSRVSRAVTALEKDLGVTLFYRTTRQLSLTQSGRTLFERAQSQIHELENAIRTVNDASQGMQGVLKITAVDDMAPLLNPILRAFRQLHPGVRIHLHLTIDVVDIVKDGVDIAIRIGKLKDANLKAKLLGTLPFVLVASPQYLRQAQKIEQISDLLTHPLILFGPELKTVKAKLKLENKKGESEILAVEPVFKSNNTPALLDMALKHVGVAFIPAFVCAAEIERGNLIRVLDNYEGFLSPAYMMWPNQKVQNPTVRAFLDFAFPKLSNHFHGT